MLCKPHIAFVDFDSNSRIKKFEPHGQTRGSRGPNSSNLSKQTEQVRLSIASPIYDEWNMDGRDVTVIYCLRDWISLLILQTNTGSATRLVLYYSILIILPTPSKLTVTREIDISTFCTCALLRAETF